MGKSRHLIAAWEGHQRRVGEVLGAGLHLRHTRLFEAVKPHGGPM